MWEASMNRRSFLKTAVILTGAMRVETCISAVANSQINTVLGPVPPANLGRTLMHEHILEDFVGADRIAEGRYDAEDVIRIALPHLKRVKSAGCDTLVECTPAYLGRNPRLLAQLSRASGLQIITNTGYYGAAGGRYVPSAAFSETAPDLAAHWTGEFQEGIASTGIRPGFIKIGVDAGPLSEMAAKLVSAAGITHLQTGLIIAAHTGDGVAAMAELALLKKGGVPPAAFIWMHAQDEKDRSLHFRAAAQGSWVEFDGISEETLGESVDWVLEMKRSGFLNRVLISQDAGWYHVGEPGGGAFRGYTLLFARYLPQLRKAGLSDSDIRTLIVENPRLALSPARPQ